MIFFRPDTVGQRTLTDMWETWGISLPLRYLLTLNGLNSIIGRGVVIHAGRDDMGKVSKA